MDVRIFDHDGRDDSILYKFAHSARQKAIVAAAFSRFERARIFEASFSTLSAGLCPSQVAGPSSRPQGQAPANKRRSARGKLTRTRA
jgi:hypothetical protein